jgi:hypothetical protein
MFWWNFGFSLGSKAFQHKKHILFSLLLEFHNSAGLASFQNLGSVRKNKAYNPSSEFIFITANSCDSNTP